MVHFRFNSPSSLTFSLPTLIRDRSFPKTRKKQTNKQTNNKSDDDATTARGQTQTPAKRAKQNKRMNKKK